MITYKPTDSELEILQIIWQDGPSSVRAINDILNQRREVGYTTTLKLMQIMNEKGIVERDTAAKSHIYRANAREYDTKNSLLTDFVNTTFQGSAMSLVMQALGNNQASQSELNELKDLISQIENQQPNGK